MLWDFLWVKVSAGNEQKWIIFWNQRRFAAFKSRHDLITEFSPWNLINCSKIWKWQKIAKSWCLENGDKTIPEWQFVRAFTHMVSCHHEEALNYKFKHKRTNKSFSFAEQWLPWSTAPVITCYGTALYPSHVLGKTRNKNLERKPWVHEWP